MKHTFLGATAVASLLLVVAVGELRAQGGNVLAGAGKVAVIDINYIFKKNTRFEQMMQEMKRDYEAAEKVLKAEHTRIMKMAEQQKAFTPGSVDYKKLDEEVTRLQGDFTVKASLKKKELLERESSIYYTVYREISEEVKHHADRNGFSLVLRFNGDPVDPSSRQSVLNGISNPVVYQSGAIDITPVILDVLNRRAAGGINAAGRTGTGVQRR